VNKFRLPMMFLTIFSCLFTGITEAAQAEDALEAIIEINEENTELIFHSDTPVILDFYSEECPYCQKLLPIFKELYAEYGDFYRFATMIVNEENEVTDYFHIKTLPTVLFIKDGKEIARLSGNITKKKFKSEIKRNFCGSSCK
jgi:thioredoxin-like negative regulator of GroEL